jgi:hypothetical protein
MLPTAKCFARHEIAQSGWCEMPAETRALGQGSKEDKRPQQPRDPPERAASEAICNPDTMPRPQPAPFRNADTSPNLRLNLPRHSPADPPDDPLADDPLD